MKIFKRKKYSFIKLLYLFMISVMTFSCSPRDKEPVGIFDTAADVGDPDLKGATGYDAETGEYRLTGAGENIWSVSDEFHFASLIVEGNFIMRARVRFTGEGVNPHRKMGIMLRDSAGGTAAHVSAVVHGDGLSSLQYRKKEGGETEEVKTTVSGPGIIQLERRGDTFIFSCAPEGDTFSSVEVTGLPFKEKANLGLFICSHEADVKETAIFDNVRLVIPAPGDFVPYQDYTGSHIEILDVESGKREIIHSSPLSLQAPNWTPDGNKLIYNSEGRLYGFNLETSSIDEINTGFAVNNNNDHVLSFDGKLLGISDHTEHPDNESLIYVLPAEGGTPEKVTNEAPSYLHGFSPDGEFMVYTAGRDEADHLDVYKISLLTGEEIRLTDAPGLDDGSEYSPDGRYIYFNSSRTGTMQIWRMNPDGSGQEQLTFDEYNDWFPHVSPDGQWLVFISYSKEIEADDHPFYKNVYIRLMPAAGGEPRVIAYLYGGQGSMNVNSWSPDSRKIAFVSNTVIK
ncbi:MAG: TolB family protein [Bacteroidota bacterium]